jgi:hypothetical protein
VKPQTTAAARIHEKPNWGKIHHLDQNKTSTITRIWENSLTVNLMHNPRAVARRWGKHKWFTHFSVQAVLVLNIIILEDQKLIFNCNASGILSNMLVSAGFTVCALNYKEWKSSYTLQTLIHICREENCVLLDYYTSCGNSLPTFQEISPKTSVVRNYHYTLWNNLALSSQLPHHESLISCTVKCNYLIYVEDKQYKISVTKA